MIDGHVWRPTYGTTGTGRGLGPVLDRPCDFMNCRRPRGEHARAVCDYRRVKP